MKPDRVLSMLGIAAKAGSVASGEFSTEKAVKEGRAYLVIVAQDASDNTKKMFRNMTEFYHVIGPCTYIEDSKESFNFALLNASNFF